ncbi:MAG: FMN-binding protein [Firmicutes bacterium]|nr:FMN-binding protein [Bacillota bacterium]
MGLTELTETSAKADPAITPVSGATISSNGVHYGVYAALEQFKEVGGVN